MNVMTKDQEDLYRSLSDEVCILHMQWLLVFHPLFAIEENVKVLNEAAPGTFHLIQSALLDEIILTFTRLTDPSKRWGLRKLVKKLDPRLHQALIRKLEAQFRILEEVCKPFRSRRNRWIAHRDMAVWLSEGATSEIGVSRLMVEKALKELRIFMHEWEHYFKNGEVAYEVVSLDGDGKTLIEILKRCVNYTE